MKYSKKIYILYLRHLFQSTFSWSFFTKLSIIQITISPPVQSKPNNTNQMSTYGYWAAMLLIGSFPAEFLARGGELRRCDLSVKKVGVMGCVCSWNSHKLVFITGLFYHFFLFSLSLNLGSFLGKHYSKIHF